MTADQWVEFMRQIQENDNWAFRLGAGLVAVNDQGETNIYGSGEELYDGQLDFYQGNNDGDNIGGDQIGEDGIDEDHIKREANIDGIIINPGNIDDGVIIKQDNLGLDDIHNKAIINNHPVIDKSDIKNNNLIINGVIGNEDNTDDHLNNNADHEDSVLETAVGGGNMRSSFKFIGQHDATGGSIIISQHLFIMLYLAPYIMIVLLVIILNLL